MAKLRNSKYFKRLLSFALVFAIAFSFITISSAPKAHAISTNVATYYDDDFDWCSSPDFTAFSVTITYIAMAATCEDDEDGNPQTDTLYLCVDEIAGGGIHSYCLPFTADGSIYSTSVAIVPGVYYVYVLGTTGIVKDYCRLLFSTTV